MKAGAPISCVAATFVWLAAMGAPFTSGCHQPTDETLALPRSGAPSRAEIATSTERKDPEFTMGTTNNVQLRCKLETSRTHLVVNYEVSNYSGVDIYVYATPRRRWEDQRGIQPWGEVCDGGGGTVNIIFGRSPYPPYSTVSARDPLPVKLGVGAKRSESVLLPLPLREWNVYYQPYGPGVQLGDSGYLEFTPVRVRQVRTIVDFVRSDSQGFGRGQPSAWGVASGVQESVSCSTPLNSSVLLERRAGRDESSYDRGWLSGDEDAGSPGRSQRRGVVLPP
jgi:hypothetical protein